MHALGNIDDVRGMEIEVLHWRFGLQWVRYLWFVEEQREPEGLLPEGLL